MRSQNLLAKNSENGFNCFKRFINAINKNE